MKKNIFILTVYTITLLFSLTVTAQTKTVILTAGQSNTAGRQCAERLGTSMYNKMVELGLIGK